MSTIKDMDFVGKKLVDEETEAILDFARIFVRITREIIQQHENTKELQELEIIMDPNCKFRPILFINSAVYSI